jgi:hypothetical protein
MESEILRNSEHTRPKTNNGSKLRGLISDKNILTQSSRGIFSILPCLGYLLLFDIATNILSGVI